MLSSSKFDVSRDSNARQADEAAVRLMYENAPYPDLGSDLKDLSFFWKHLPEITRRSDVRFLDVGCGTGHYLVGVTKTFQNWTCCGVDLSTASLDVAKQLAQIHDVSVELHNGSYLDPIPFDEAFDVISAMGTIHHAADPVAALVNLKQWMKPDGVMLLHLYGLRGDAKKFDIKEMLSIFQPDLTNYADRFGLYDALIRHNSQRRPLWKKALLNSPADYYFMLRNYFRDLRRRSKNISWSPSWTHRYDTISAPWIDHFCHPCERAYEIRDVQALLDASGFEPVFMLKQGIERPHLIPPEWRERYETLNFWDKARLSELLADGGGSFNLIVRPV